MTKLSHLVTIIKDKASQGKAALFSQRPTLALLRATTPYSFTPPSHKYLSTLLSSGDGSRATASASIVLLMDRLQSTHNSAVALKCLVLVHHIIKHGNFILRDQLSVYPSTGGRNYLNLSNFRDNSTPISWELSSWIRWYAQYIEQLLDTCRFLGFFLGTRSSATTQNEESEERVSGKANADLLRETDSLLALVEEIGKRPDPASTNKNRLVDAIVNLVGDDWISIRRELWIEVKELGERVGCLSFGEAIELVCAMKKLEECKERTMEVGQNLWSLAREVKEKAGMEAHRKDDRLFKRVKRHRATESHRFAKADPVLNSANLIHFSSGRLLL